MAGLSPIDRFAYNLLGERARTAKTLPKLEESLRKAQMPVRAEAYLAKCILFGGIGAVFGFVLGLVLISVLVLQLGLPAATWVLVVFVPPMVGYTTYVAMFATPASNAKKRGKNINQRLAYATNYIAAMASAGVIPAEIFKSLAKQEIYGEVAKEAAMIYKDLEVHGKDIVTSLRRAIDRSPSIKFQELLQGGITTVSSGGDLTAYFQQKAQRYQWENRVEQKTFIDTMGLMAETYVTAAVAGPLFLIVMVAIIVLMGSGTMVQLQLIIFLLLPVINFGFMFGLKSMIPEV
ncbi:MAG TPA: type II secretion system F family protein [Candidatus Thermoplasmatota archaeon]|nr:type II secretion system F family protein [Candidatus Thermoplasmatota archaeon]